MNYDSSFFVVKGGFIFKQVFFIMEMGKNLIKLQGIDIIGVLIFEINIKYFKI